MRSVLMFAIAGAAACSFSSSALPPDTTGVDGGGAPDAAPPGDAPRPDDPDDPMDDDDDDDGVLDVADNCPAVPNAGQFDEDGDATGDECDRCPQLAGAAADADGDGDGVGDGCDPNPATAGDQLALWHGFHVDGAALPADLTLVHGAAARWSIAGGSLRFTRAPGSTDWGVPAFDTGSPRHTVDTAFQVTASYGVASAAGATVDVAANDSDLFDCQARLDESQRELWRWAAGAFDPWIELARTNATTGNDAYRIVLHRRAAELACTTVRGTDAPVALASPRPPLGNTRAGLFARNVDVQFRYLAIYK